MKSKYSEIEGLIEQIQKIAFDKPREQTFLEVCRCSERENVYSDILKFFFDSDEEHNFRNLFIRSLLTLLNQEKVDEYTKLVEREDTTSDGLTPNYVPHLIRELSACSVVYCWS